MWVHSGLFQICLFVAYSVKTIYNVEINFDKLHKTKADHFKEIINRASSLLNKYYLLKSEYTGDYVESDHEDISIVNELKKRLKEATAYREDQNNDTPQKIFEINPFENRISNLMKKDNDRNQQSPGNLEYLYDDLPRWPINNKTFSGELTSIKFSKDLVAFVKSLLKNKYSIMIYKDRGNKIERWMKTALKKYYAPSILFFVLKPVSSKSQLILFNGADIFAVKYVKGDKKDVPTIDNVELIEHINKNQNVNVKSKLSKEANNETLRVGCVACAKAQLRRCFKALKSSIKNSCRTFHCKEGFKSSFKSNSKSACLYEFSEEEKGKINCDDISKSKNSTLRWSRFKDKLRSGNAGACKSSASLRELNLRDDGQESSSTDTVLLNILRDKYEKACEKALYKKCNRACSCAIKVTCDEFRCIKKKINRLTKDCKAQCKSQFVKTEDSSDESSDSDSSDSVSGEDTSEDDRSKD